MRSDIEHQAIEALVRESGRSGGLDNFQIAQNIVKGRIEEGGVFFENGILSVSIPSDIHDNTAIKGIPEDILNFLNRIIRDYRLVVYSTIEGVHEGDEKIIINGLPPLANPEGSWPENVGYHSSMIYIRKKTLADIMPVLRKIELLSGLL